MKRPLKYKTKHGEAIENYFKSLEGKHTTAGDIASYFEEIGQTIGLTTIYRQLDILVERGKLNKYNLDNVSGACYQYIADEDKDRQIHFKCEDCGHIIHINCSVIEGLPDHIDREHSFQINPMKTLFYGRCSACK